MTRARGIVKRSDRSERMKSRWSSDEIYRDGLTYRAWKSQHAKAQRARELRRATEIPLEVPAVDDPARARAAEPAAAKAEAEAPPDRTAARATDTTGESDGEAGAPAGAPAATSPKERRPRWRRTRRS